MKLLLDTCAYVWLVDKPAMLSAVARAALRESENSRHICAISVSEVHRLVRKRRLAIQAPDGLDTWFQAGFTNHRINAETITWQITHVAETLPPIHNDPADRFIIATAQVLGAKLITPDTVIPRYPGIEVIW